MINPLQQAVKDYYEAETPQQFRNAYEQMRRCGAPASYNEIDSLMRQSLNLILRLIVRLEICNPLFRSKT